MSIRSRMRAHLVGVGLIGCLGACGAPPIAPARAELMAAADRRLAAREPAAALADYLAAAELGALDAGAVARRDEALAAVVATELEAAAALDDAGEIGRLLALRLALAGAELAAPAALDDALAGRADAQLQRAARASDAGDVRGALDAVRLARRVAIALARPPLTELVDRVARALGEAHVRRAFEAVDAGQLVVADLHLRLAASLGVPVSDDARALLDAISASRGARFLVEGSAPSCDSLVEDVRQYVRRDSEPKLAELSFQVRLELACSYDAGWRTASIDGETQSGFAYEVRFRGTIGVQLLGVTDASAVDEVGRYGLTETDEGAWGRGQAFHDATRAISRGLEEIRTRAIARVAEDARARFATATGMDREQAALVLWLVASDADALVEVLGVDRDVIETLYVGADVPPLHPESPADERYALPAPDAGPAVRALEAHRLEYGDRSKIAAEQRVVGFFWPHLGVAVEAASSPLPGVARADTVSLHLGGGPAWFFLDVTRPEAGGDARGWAFGWAPRIPVADAAAITFGLQGGRVTGPDGTRASHLSTPLHLNVPLGPYALVSTGIDINWYQVFGGTDGPPGSYHLSPWTTALEVPLLWGPWLYVRGDATRWTGAPDPWTFGVTVGWRVVAR